MMDVTRVYEQRFEELGEQASDRSDGCEGKPERLGAMNTMLRWSDDSHPRLLLGAYLSQLSCVT